MKKLTTLVVLGVAVAGTVGFSARGAAEAAEPSEAEVNAALDARLHEVLGNLLRAGRPETRGADTTLR